jgi:predicted O-linked N-acetylglucosamine transferase (SPINDLY family)
MIAQQVGHVAIAIDLMTRAISADPTNPIYLSNLGNVLQEQGKLDVAVNCYRQAVLLNPDYCEAYYNLGITLLRQGDLEEAVVTCRQAVLLKPDYFEAYGNLGIALFQLGECDEAITCYLKAISLRVDYHEAYNNLGIAFRQQGKIDEAIRCYQQALSLNPGYFEAYNNLGIALQQQGKLRQAVISYHQALSLRPDYPDAHHNLGYALQQQGAIEEAVSCYHKALSLKPGYTKAYSNLLYLHASTRDIPPEAERELATKWECCALNDVSRAAARTRRFFHQPRSGRRLKVGIVSAEIGEHAVAEFLEPVLEQLDRSRFHLTLFPSTRRTGRRAARIGALVDDCRPLVGMPDAKAVELIRSAAVDILMDTTGHTSDSRLGIFAHRAAPVQLSYIGYWSTTGLTEMDWYLSDIYSPSFYKEHFSEELWRLPHLATCYRGDQSLPSSSWVPSLDGTIWLGSFNRYLKIREATLNLWAKVMKAIPRSKLLLEDRAIDESDSHERILTLLGSHGISGDRIEFEPSVPGHERHMVLYDRLDIALDTIPYNSGTTACDALWMGVPLVALEGDWAGGRMASTFLRALGKPEWIAQDEDEYVAITAKLAHDVAGRTVLRSSQRSLMANSPLCDYRGLAQALGDAFEQMFDIYQNKKFSDTASEL